MVNLKDKTIFITGSSRGIGLQIALRFAVDGANIIVIGKTAEPDPRMPGTIYSTAEAIEEVGGKALPLQVDIRDENEIETAVNKAVEIFGGIDILVNNAGAHESALSILDTPMKRFDLVFGVNVRGTFACSRACLPHLKKAANPHILIISPPINAIRPKWFKDYNLAYAMSKFDMSMCTMSLALEFAKDGIAVNSLWPKYAVDTAAVKLKMADEIYQATLHPKIVADAAYLIVTSNSRKVTGNFYLDADLLEASGQSIEQYILNPNAKPILDFFID